jgi:phenylpyruvate tautomerase PptA (4-oxalocrotonate tautomerase family)
MKRFRIALDESLMAQIKVYGLADVLKPIQMELSEVIHGCAQTALGLPAHKRFHRFIGLAREDFYTPEDRTEQYLILEISLFEGRSVETKKHLLRLLMDRLHTELKIPLNDIEITIFETPKANWGIRGWPGDELHLNYKVDI